MKVLFVGTGLIGGSFSLAMQKHGFLTEARGYSNDQDSLVRSMELGIISQKFDALDKGIAWADWIVLSIPVNVISQLLPSILDQLSEHQVVIDFGSTKEKICAEVANHPKRPRFIAAHPIAGTEYSGPEAAFDSLFEEQMMIVCEKEKSDTSAYERFEAICSGLKIKMEVMAADEHDRHLAYISHLSHITSYALSNAVLAKEKDGEIILELAGSGFESTVRLAKSSPEMWTPIFLENKKRVLESLNEFMKQASDFRDLLEKDDEKGITQFLEQGRTIKKVIG